MPAALAALLAVAVAPDLQDPDLARRVEQLELKVEALTGELERTRLGDVAPPFGGPGRGLAPAAAKVYSQSAGEVSIGGYGELQFAQIAGATDVADALRAVTYLGYRFDEHWVVNTEIEIEHGSTSASSGTASSGGSVSLEFGYLDHSPQEGLGFRAGLVLVPVGLVNEQHEPTRFLAVRRSQTETRIVPSTWRELGIGVYGEQGAVDYRAYVLTSLDGEEFGPAGLRGGRQKGNRVAADDIGFAARADVDVGSGMTVGVGGFTGRAGQDQLRGTRRIPALQTTVVAVHAELQHGPWRVRALVSVAYVDGAGAFGRATGRALARRMEGYYGEVGYDVLARAGVETGHALLPFVRYEYVDTHAGLPDGVVRDRSQRDRVLTLGCDWLPRPEIVFKVDFEHWQHDTDRWSLGLGYVF